MTLPQAIQEDDEVRGGATPAAPMGAVENRRSKPMYAVIKTGGKQYRVQPDDVLEIERLPGAPGDMIEFSHVLLVVGDSGIEVGTPIISDALVAAELVDQTRGDKIKVFKKKRRKHYRRTLGHRQDLTQIRILEILTGGARPSPKKAAAKKKAPAKKAEQPAPALSEAAAEPAPEPKAKPAAKPKAPAKKAAPKPAKKAAKTAEAPGDDLTQIAGIGPVIATKLQGLGYTRLQQIADLTPEQVAEIGEELKFKGRIEREEWIEQAKDLVAGKPARAKSDKQSDED
jgi:large subunit ribosomal protein L21